MDDDEEEEGDYLGRDLDYLDLSADFDRVGTEGRPELVKPTKSHSKLASFARWVDQAQANAERFTASLGTAAQEPVDAFARLFGA